MLIEMHPQLSVLLGYFDHGVRTSNAGLRPKAEARKEKSGDDAEIAEDARPMTYQPVQ